MGSEEEEVDMSGTFQSWSREDRGQHQGAPRLAEQRSMERGAYGGRQGLGTSGPVSCSFLCPVPDLAANSPMNEQQLPFLSDEYNSPPGIGFWCFRDRADTSQKAQATAKLSLSKTKKIYTYMLYMCISHPASSLLGHESSFVQCLHSVYALHLLDKQQLSGYQAGYRQSLREMIFT